MKCILNIAAATAVIVLQLTGCSGISNHGTVSEYTADNEIMTYSPVNMDKRIITIGKYDSFVEEPLEQALEARFPELDIVFLENLAGPDPVAYMALQSE